MTTDVDLDALFSRREEKAARAELAGHFDSLATYLAGRYKGRGESIDDLEQVARLGLLKAIDRFDLDFGVQFSTYATRTIVGELKRHLRDKSWSVRVPRSLQERWLEVSRAIEDLQHQLGRSPTIAQIARAIDADEEEVLEALDAGSAYSAASLDAPAGGESDSPGTISDFLGGEDPEFEWAGPWADVRDRLDKLPEREKTIIYLRFFEDLTQSEIAERVGVSQMHVSRLLRHSLELLR